MWQVLIDHFRRFPAQERVVRLLIRGGLRTHNGKVHAGDIEIADTAIACAAHVDRRIVRSAVETITQDPRLSAVFQRLQPTLHLRDVAPELGCGVIEVIPVDAARLGILAGVSRLIAEAGLNIRQAIVEDPEFTEAPRLHIITGTRVPGELIPRLQAVPGVRGVTVY